MDLIKLIESNFLANIEASKFAMQVLPDKIMKSAMLMTQCIKNNGKILACGNGGSASDAQHFVAELVNRFMLERRPFSAIALNSDVATMTAIANDCGYENVFAKQVQALGNENDVLLAITTSGNSLSVINAVQEALDQGLSVIALTGNDGGSLANLLKEYKHFNSIGAKCIEIRVMESITARIQEIHILIIHCLCEIIEKELCTLIA